MDPILTVTSSDIAGVLTYAGDLFTDFNVLILVAIGLPVGFWIIRRVISLVMGRARA